MPHIATTFWARCITITVHDLIAGTILSCQNFSQSSIGLYSANGTTDLIGSIHSCPEKPDKDYSLLADKMEVDVFEWHLILGLGVVAVVEADSSQS